MNEIIRIHVAKVPFNIETAAKKQLDAYLKDLQTYLNDDEVYADIEQRIVELLQNRGIAQDGVIAEADVAAIKKQLGEPQDFQDDSSDAATTTKRRLFRDPDNGFLGGVASGLAAYLGVSALLVDAAFVIAFLATGGSAILLYVLAWIIIPPAKTAADRLELEGKQATVQSIQKTEAPNGNREAKVFRVLSIIGGVVILVGSLLFFTSWLLLSNYTVTGMDQFGMTPSWVGITQKALGIVSSLAALALGLLAAYACFTMRLPKRLLITGVILIAIIILSAVAFAGMSAFANYSTYTNLMPY